MHNTWLPVAYGELIAKCGHPDRGEEHAPVILPVPSLFREWELLLDLRKSMIAHQSQPVFVLASVFGGREILFANVTVLRNLLSWSAYSLTWLIRGERQAFLDFGKDANFQILYW